MSKYDYDESVAIFNRGESFYALIMAAMRKADTANSFILEAAFPGVRMELQQRYNAPGGLLEGEADVALGGLIEPSHRGPLTSEQSCDFVLRNDCIRIINNLWVDQCGGCLNLDTCETCRAYSQAIDAIEGDQA